jgi:plastocyanin
MNAKKLVAVLICGAILLFTPIACGKTVPTTVFGEPVTITASPLSIPITTYPAKEAPPAEDKLIIVIGGGYADAVSYVVMGQKFKWFNADHEAHSVTAVGVDMEEPEFWDLTLQPGESVEFSLADPGNYKYFDTLHPENVAELIVES